jgi:hypothetical protein
LRISTRNFAKIRAVLRMFRFYIRMTLRIRRIIFYSFVFLFLIVGFVVVSYSQGWRINIKNCKTESQPHNKVLLLFQGLKDCGIALQKIGAIFIETKPKGVVIKINDKIFEDKSGLIQSGTLINNLLPKTYHLKIEKDGYLPWIKNAVVESGLVTEFPFIVLIPQEIKKNSLTFSKTINNFWLNSQQKIVFKSNDHLYFYTGPLEREQNFLVLTNKLKGDEFVAWSEDNNKIIVRDSKNQIYYLYELNNLSKAININAAFNNFKKTGVVEVIFYPLESNRLIVKDKNNFLYILDFNRLQLENLIKEPVIGWTIKSPNLYYIKAQTNAEINKAQTNADYTQTNAEVNKAQINADYTQTNAEINKAQTNAEKSPRESASSLPRSDAERLLRGLRKSAFSPRESEYILVSFNLITKTENFTIELPSQLINQQISEINVSGNKIAILNPEGSLYIFSQTTKEFNQIAHSVEKFVFSPDNKKIAFFDKDGKLNIYFLEDYQKGIHKKASEVISFDFYKGVSRAFASLPPKGMSVKNIFWYKDSNHLFVQAQTNAEVNKAQTSAEKSPRESAFIDFIELDDRLPINKYILAKEISNPYYEPTSNRLYFIENNKLSFIEF